MNLLKKINKSNKLSNNIYIAHTIFYHPCGMMLTGTYCVTHLGVPCSNVSVMFLYFYYVYLGFYEYYFDFSITVYYAYQILIKNTYVSMYLSICTTEMVIFTSHQFQESGTPLQILGYKSHTQVGYPTK